MKKELISEIIQSHIERVTAFEAALELLCVTVAELKNNVAAIQKGQDRNLEICEIKKVLENILSQKLSEKELVLLKGPICKYIDLCDSLTS